MQIILLALIFISILAVVIFKINGKFEIKETIILSSVIVLSIIIVVLFLDKQDNKMPELFKNKYQEVKEIKILQLSYERLNNKNISSDTNFIYNFDYIIEKNNKQLVCKAFKVQIKQIQDEYVFINFDKFKEVCKNK